MNPSQDDLETMRREFAAQKLDAHGMQLAVIEQMWLELARALAAQGALNVDALAQRLEEHAQRAPDHPNWFFGLVDAARMLRNPSTDLDNLVQ